MATETAEEALVIGGKQEEAQGSLFDFDGLFYRVKIIVLYSALNFHLLLSESVLCYIDTRDIAGWSSW